MGIADGAADEAEAALFQVAAQGVGNRGAGRNVAEASPGVLKRAAVYEAPLVGSEGAELLLDLQESSGVGDCRFDFQAVADNVRVPQQFGNLRRVETGYQFRIKPGKGGTVSFAFSENGDL